MFLFPEPASAAGTGTFSYRVELTADGETTASLVQKMVPAGEGFDVHVFAEGASTGSIHVATMRHDGDLEVFEGAGDEGWWAGFLADNGVDAMVLPVIYAAGGQKLFDLLVAGNGIAHLITHLSFDPDNPWGPCPGPDDAPTCPPVPVVLEGICLFDVDQCSGGPLPMPGGLRDALVAVQDPDVDPANVLCSQDPDGDPCRVRTFLRLSPDFADPAGGDLGVTRLAIDGSGDLRHLRPGGI